jgi:hypothetical protein
MFSRFLTRSVIEAQNIAVPNAHEIKIITGSYCLSVKYDPGNSVLLYSIIEDIPCVAPDTGFSEITPTDFRITNFLFSPTGTGIKAVNLEIEGFYENSLTDHPVKYRLTMTKRI